ncbi:MAG: DUF4139 domain-containing protein [Pontiella sp.]
MNHLSAQQLRDYTFDMRPETAVEIAAHLEQCAECRSAFQSLEAQFQTLDVLQDQPEISEERLKAVLAEGRNNPTPKVIPIRPLAIATLAAGLALAFFMIRPNHQPHARIADHPPAPQQSPREVHGTTSLAELRATRPFAPASNIELNVLPRRDEVQLTIYNAEDLTLVRETRKITLKRGWNWLQFMWSNTRIDPTSLELKLSTHADQVEITQLVYPPRLNELARWTLFSEFSGEAKFELTYFTAGLKWNADYEATLSSDEQTMELKSRIRVDNHSGEDYENAQVRMVVGHIHIVDNIETLAKRPSPYGRPGACYPLPDLFGSASALDVASSLSAKKAERKQILKSRLSEYQLYTIEGRETIPDGWGKRLPNFEAREIRVTHRYKFEAERWGKETRRFLSFANTKADQLGNTPLPQGQMRVFKKASNGGLAYLEQAHLQYIPIGQAVELELGTTKKVTVEPRLMRTRAERMAYDSKGNISGWDEITDWNIEIINTQPIPVEVEIMRWAGSSPWKIRSGAAFEKMDAEHVQFTEQVEPHSKRLIKYELTIRREKDD